MAEKKTVTVTLAVEEILYDVQNKTHLAGESLSAEGKKNYETVATMQVTSDDDYNIKRSVTTALSELKLALGEYLSGSTCEVDNRVQPEVDTEGTVKIQFSLPSNYDLSAVDSLPTGIHDYIVNKSIAEWYTLTNKEDAQAHVELATLALERAKKALYKRSRPKRPAHTA